MKRFRDPQEFRKVFEHVFVLMNEHPEVGRTLRDAHAPHRFVFTDLGLELNVDAAPDSEERNGRYLHWVWGPAKWKPTITLTMSSETANRFFQGKENVALAVALGRVKVSRSDPHHSPPRSGDRGHSPRLPSVAGGDGAEAPPRLKPCARHWPTSTLRGCGWTSRPTRWWSPACWCSRRR